MLDIYKKLNNVQSELICPKNNFNSFSGFKYRSCEDILNAVKPLLQKYELILTLTDSIELVADRFYLKATATLYDCDNKDTISTTAYAREEQVKKGMDSSQITGATSSYARKYALNGLFAIDDTKDADTQDNTEKAKQPPKKTTKPTATTDNFKCSVCGKAMKETHFNNTVSKFGQSVCSQECLHTVIDGSENGI